MPAWSFRESFSTPEQMRCVLNEMLKDIRHQLNLDEEPWYDLKIILHELCCNALEHGKDPVEVFSVVCHSDKRLHILVCDSGDGFQPAEKDIASKDAEHGRGLHIVSCLADDIMFNSTANKVLVRMQV
jgi:anti-sigma regulatory factor (Ser/Thr protein kinase)